MRVGDSQQTLRTAVFLETLSGDHGLHAGQAASRPDKTLNP